MRDVLVWEWSLAVAAADASSSPVDELAWLLLAMLLVALILQIEKGLRDG